MADSNGSNGKSTLRRADAVFASAILDLCQDVKVEVLKLEGIANAVLHRRVVTSRELRRVVLYSVRAVGQRHLDAVARVERDLGESAA